MATELEKKLAHSRAAYRYAIASLPDTKSQQPWPLRRGDFEFSSAAQIDSMVIELGWAFFCRYEGCVEAFLKQQGVALSKKKSLTDWLEERMEIPDDRRKPLRLYREIRNKLHHEDGAMLDGLPDQEIHLMPEHMERFYGFFVWLGEQVEQLTATVQNEVP